MSKKVVIDPGHGGKDHGAVSQDLKEKDLTLKIAKRVKSELEIAYGIDVIMTRTTDKYLTLKERTDFANKQKADFFCSIHINAGGGTGYEDYIYDRLSDSSETAKKRTVFHNEIKKVLEKYNIRNRGMKKKNLHVLRETSMSSVLTEVLFIDNKEDQKLLKNEKFLEDIAVAHANGIAAVLGIKKSNVENKANKEQKQQSTQTKKSSSNKETNTSLKLLKYGDRGKEVEELQKILKKYGYDIGRTGIDGIFGKRTEQAVKEFQKDEGLKTDGIVGPETRKALENRKKFPGRFLRYQLPYMRGKDVKAVQRKVGVKVDGIYGEKTRRAVRQYQKKHKLLVDGIVGPETWNSMFK